MQTPDGSNFIKHMMDCKKRPPKHDFFPEWTPENTTKSEDTDGESSLQNQRKNLKTFTMRGLENPAKEFSRRVFRELLSKGIIRDDQPFSFCEGKGIREVFEYLLPPSVQLPSRQTVRRDLDKLHQTLSAKVTAIMKVTVVVSRCHYLISIAIFSYLGRVYLQGNKSRIAVASDAWSSKSSVYAFIAPVGFWINDDWKLEELVLDFLPLNGNHSGAHSGKVLFTALSSRGVTKKISYQQMKI